MSENLEPAVNPLVAELEKYQKEMGAIQEKLNALEDQKTQLMRIGVRLEGVVAYIKQKMEAEASSNEEKK